MNSAPREGKHVLVVDDDPHILEVLDARLASAGYLVVQAASGEEALERLKTGIVDLVISDIRMPGMDGMKLLEFIEKLHPGLPMILLTAHGSISGAVDAMKHGAVDYLTKPFDGRELLAKVASVLAKSGRREEARGGRVVSFVGESRAMKELAALVDRVAPRDVNVLVLGESGTGKELVAHLIHEKSARHAGPLLIVDCGSTPAGLLESELFGHVKGSFTHAVKDKKGLIEQANQGTLFLDEIGNISSEMQVRLLRFLENHRIRRIGDVREIQVDCRVIAATNADIFQEVAGGRFREDLLYRLKVVTIHVPPLRERREDIPGLAEHFVSDFCRRQGIPLVALHPDTVSAILAYSWPGNVRELKNTLEGGVVLCSGGTLLPVDLQLPLPGVRASAFAPFAPAPPASAAPTPSAPQAPEGNHSLSLEESEKKAIIRALEESGWVQKDAAPLLGVSRRALNYKIQKYAIEIPRRRAGRK
ncbi:sigma-54-dependent transcriptional regulator [Desulfolutivibrio sp.]|uniref:sigma-54-dependent transcriptional regulator n=1 Tax=Desulfolutivibrio sp. TaxID=2773296 RepID=UPI002F964040